MDVRLVIVRKKKRVWDVQIRHSEATLGRAQGCTVRIPSSQVSRLHCRLHMANGLVTAEDLESANGTFINGKRVHGAEVVHPGDRLSVGPVTFLVEYELATATLQSLGSEEDEPAQETEAYVSLPDESGLQATLKPPAATEADVEVVEDAGSQTATRPPPGEMLEEVEDSTDVETVPLAEEDELHISDSGTLRDFLVELDEADKHPHE